MILSSLLLAQAALPVVKLMAPALDVDARCRMLSVQQIQYDLHTVLTSDGGKGHRWMLEGARSTYPLADGKKLSGFKLPSGSYVFDVFKDGLTYRYELALAYSGFMPGEPRERNAIMTVSQSQPTGAAVYVASGVCDVQTRRRQAS